MKHTLGDDLVGLGLGDALDLAEELLGRVGDGLERRVPGLGELLAVLLGDAKALYPSQTTKLQSAGPHGAWSRRRG